MDKLLEIKSDRYFIKGCLNLTLKSLLPCSKCGFWNGKQCEDSQPENSIKNNEIIKGRWEIMKFEIPHEEIQLPIIETMTIPNNEVIKMKCKHCGLEVDHIPKWKEGECPSGELQHEFRAIRDKQGDS